jgi:hypothetical protein
MWYSNSPSRFIPKRIENICPHNDLYMAVHSNVILIAKKWKHHKCSPAVEQINTFLERNMIPASEVQLYLSEILFL